MPNKNRVELIGCLGADPDTRYTASGIPVVNLSVATNEKWRDRKTGHDQERTEWHKVVCFGAMADQMAQARKGDHVYIDGRLQTEKWQDNSGNDRYTTKVKANLAVKLVWVKGEQGEQSAASQGRVDPQAPRQDYDQDIKW